MSVYLLYEWDDPKDEERLKKRRKLADEVLWPYYERRRKEGVKWESITLTEGYGRTVQLDRFETMEDFDKMWNDEERQRNGVMYSRLVDNLNVRFLRPYKPVEPG